MKLSAEMKTAEWKKNPREEWQNLNKDMVSGFYFNNPLGKSFFGRNFAAMIYWAMHSVTCRRIPEEYKME